jgi:serine O-acetyltransferase
MDESGEAIRDIPRHPIVEDNVVIYAGASILGRVRIGQDTVIGGNVWITEDVSSGSKVVQKR